MAIDNFMIFSLYELLDEENLDDPIAVKPSSRTMFEGQSMRTHWVKTILRESKGRIELPTLEDFCDELPEFISDQVFHETNRDDGFIHDLCHIVLSAGNEPLLKFKDSLISDFRAKYGRPDLLEMKLHYYPGREDMRAYYVDHWPLRCLVGSILQQLLVPRNERIQKKMAWRTMMPRQDKNRIEWTIITPQGMATILIFGDISSFSSSNVNSWVYVLVMYLIITTKEMKHLDDTFPISVDGAPMGCRLSHILFLYLYLVVFAPAHHLESKFFAMGGYLGVAGNMSLTTLSFALFLHHKSSIIRTSWPNITFMPRIGGDDFIISLTGPLDRCMKIANEILADAGKCVGKVKEPVITVLSGYVSDQVVGTYCKKTVRSYNTINLDGSTTSTVMSDEVIPLLESFLTSSPGNPIAQKEKSYRELFFASTNLLQRVPQSSAIRTSLLATYARLFNLHHVVISKKEPFGDYSQFQLVGSVYASNDAIAKAVVVPDVYCAGKVYRTSIKSKLFHLLTRKLLDRVKIWSYSGSETIVLVTPKENRLITLEPRRLDSPDPSLLSMVDELVTATEDARDTLGTMWDNDVESEENSDDDLTNK
jgi:hypothetical protein